MFYSKGCWIAFFVLIERWNQFPELRQARFPLTFLSGPVAGRRSALSGLGAQENRQGAVDHPPLLALQSLLGLDRPHSRHLHGCCHAFFSRVRFRRKPARKEPATGKLYFKQRGLVH